MWFLVNWPLIFSLISFIRNSHQPCMASFLTSATPWSVDCSFLSFTNEDDESSLIVCVCQFVFSRCGIKALGCFFFFYNSGIRVHFVIFKERRSAWSDCNRVRVSDSDPSSPLCCPQVDKLEEAESQRKTEEEVTEPQPMVFGMFTGRATHWGMSVVVPE